MSDRNDTFASDSPQQHRSRSTPSFSHHHILSILFPNAIVCCSIILTLWTTISLIHYGIKTGKWRQLKRQNQAEKLNIGPIYFSIVCCGVLALTYDSAGLAFINIGFTNKHNSVLNNYCDSVSDLVYISYASVLVSTAVFFWLRQRVFFQNRLLNANYNKPVKLLSSLSLLLTVALSIGVLTFNIYPNDHEASEDGCVYYPKEEMKIGYWVSIVSVILFCQGMFLGLFIYALRSIRIPTKKGLSDNPTKNRQLQKTVNYKKVQNGSSNNLFPFELPMNQADGKFTKVSTGPFQHSACAETVRSTMGKTFAAAVTTTVLDTLEMILITHITKPGEHHRFNVMLGSINMFLHQFLLILSFAQYKRMLTSLCWLVMEKTWTIF